MVHPERMALEDYKDSLDQAANLDETDNPAVTVSALYPYLNSTNM